MDTNDFLAALERDGATFGEACEAAGLDAPVASCPGWSVADLLWHLAEVHYFWRLIVAERRDTWEGYVEPTRPADDELLSFYRSGLAETLSVLRAVDPAQANWTWSDDHTAGFVIRRMAHETAVHCCDAQLAAGLPAAVEAHLASDGIDEFLHHFVGGPAGAPPVGGSVHLHCTDVEGEWTLRPKDGDDEPFTVTREHAKGDCALRGSANDLLMALWRRAPLSTVDVVGDAAVAARFIALSPLT